MLEHLQKSLVHLDELAPVPVHIEIDASEIARVHQLGANPRIAVVIFGNGRVMPVTADSARSAGLI